MIISPSDLSYFVEIAHTKNLSRAAERLGVRQPSLSLALQRIEHSLGTEVVIRNKKGVLLTQAGKQLLVHSKLLLQSWDELRSKALASMESIQGHYRLGCHPSVALFSLTHFLPKILKKHPRLNISLHHDLSRKVTEQVISAELDLAIVVNPVEHPDLVIHPLYSDQVTFWASDCSSQDVFDEKTILICDPNLFQTQTLLRQLRKKGPLSDRILATSSLEVITELTAAGCGVGILPERVAQQAKQAPLRRIPQMPYYLDQICLLYRAENKKVKSIYKLSQAIRESLSTK